MCRFQTCPKDFDITETFGIDTDDGTFDVEINIKGGPDCDTGGCHGYETRTVLYAPPQCKLSDENILDQLEVQITDWIKDQME